MRMWQNPIYRLKTNEGVYIFVDVTTSCCPGLGPNMVIWKIAEFFKSKGVVSILDFGAGALRHTFPLLDMGFQVCAVEFKEQFERKACRLALNKAKKSPDFSALIFPDEFIKSKHKFDAALLTFVITTMPRADERRKLLKFLKKRLKANSFIFWMSQYGKYEQIKRLENQVKDGWYLHPERKNHSFYTEFNNSKIDDMLNRIGYRRIHVFSQRGNDQFRLYSRGAGKWP